MSTERTSTAPLLGSRASSAARAIYGTIAAMAVMAGAARYQSDAKIFALTVTTLVVLWLAHVYAEALAHHLTGQHRPAWGKITGAMAEEWPMLLGPAPMLAVLALGALGVLDEDRALTLALWVGLAQLVVWGMAYARSLRWGWPTAAAAGLVNGAFGFVIVLLEVAVH